MDMAGRGKKSIELATEIDAVNKNNTICKSFIKR